ncbi:four helix bundle protein [Pseudoalteromonas atlantica]|uniref:four helix bundle protein n=1 Tax=Pseudoalteromonas atlantica TaxID=288 RepID=UPI0037353643
MEKLLGKNTSFKVKGLKLGIRDFMQFENLAVWQRSADLACDIYKHFKSSKEFGLKDQITRSALSISSNIADKIAGANFERACAASKR